MKPGLYLASIGLWLIASPLRAQDAATPWAGASDVVLPTFLQDTRERVVDERPPPREDQIRTLREMEREASRFEASGTLFRDTVRSMVRREYLQRRRDRDRVYASQISAEDIALERSREDAIAIIERFLKNYPKDLRYTPDAMFRLGELYFERSNLAFQALYDAQQSATEEGEVSSLAPDYLPTIEVYRKLVRQFPQYSGRDGVYYLIGYCLNEMAKPEEALAAWLALACANRYEYDPDWKPKFPSAQERLRSKHPAAYFEHPMREVAMGPDPYLACEPLSEDARFVSETWFRVGEYHFDDYSDENALPLAISAYSQILKDKEDKNYNLALYKVAWTYYRASRYPEAIKHFAELVEWSDERKLATGAAGSELRPEAIEYLAIAFAYDDWNENQLPDPIEGKPTGFERLQNPDLLPQNRLWTPDVYFQLGQVYFDEAKYPNAISAWRMALERWPQHARAPEIVDQIAIAHQMNNEFEQAIAVRTELSDYMQGSEWWNANKDNPQEQRNAERLAENSLVVTAVYHHTNAQRLRRQCVENRDVSLCKKAQTNYALAAEAYRGYLERYPNTPQGYELHYNLADALFWSESYEQAATEYAAVRDSNVDNRYLTESARRVVESIKRVAEAKSEAGEITLRAEAPTPAGQPPQIQPVTMPLLEQRLARAREIYLARIAPSGDTEAVREAYDYNNALVLYRYGYWPLAKQRLTRIYESRCSGAEADPTGKTAWETLRAMAIALDNRDEIQHLAEDIQKRGCTFSKSTKSIDCAKRVNRSHPVCQAGQDLNALVYRDALAVNKQAERTSDPERKKQLYEQAAAMLIDAVEGNPEDRQAPVALEYAALALENTSRFETAAGLYQRIVDEVAPRKGETEEEQKNLDRIVANAYFRLAYNANRFFDFDRAVANYRVLADSKRFQGSEDPDIQTKRTDALVNSAIILERLQRYQAATSYYRRVFRDITDPELKQTALYRIAEMNFNRSAWNAAIRAMRDFISRYRNDSGASELVVRAYWRIAQSYKELNQRANYAAALRDVVSAYKRSSQAPGSLAAEYAAKADFQRIDQDKAGLESLAIKPGRPKTMKDYVTTITDQIEEGSRRTQDRTNEYEPMFAYGRPTWTIASYVRQGRAYELLARAVLNTPFTMPEDMKKRLRKLSRDDREDIRFQVEDQIKQVLDAKVRPIECFAVARYALAARAGRAGSIDDEYTRSAIDRLQAYGDERISECIAQARERDSSFAPYQSGEFARAPRGFPQTFNYKLTPAPLRAKEERR